jgi:NADPH-dependent 2,4-dienoyl-CoA reductase/sulfur reductase-like enzyme
MRLVAIGASDAGIQAALRARELDPSAEVTVILADAYPNYSICGIPYYVSGDVPDWHSLAHRTVAELETTEITLRLDTVAQRIDPERHRVILAANDGGERFLEYDAIVVATGALPVTPPIAGLDRLGTRESVHLLHSMGDTFALMRTLEEHAVARAVIVGAGYVGLEMAEALVARGVAVTQVEQLPEVLPTVDPELGALVRAELQRHGVDVACGTRVDAIEGCEPGSSYRLEVSASGADNDPLRIPADLVLVSVGVRPDTRLAADAGAELGVRGAIVVDRQMRTNLPDVLAAGDCVITHHRLLGILTCATISRPGR